MKRCDIENTILSHINDKHYIFVFTSEVVRLSWVRWTVSSQDAVDMERFIAWDDFISRCIDKNKTEGKRPIDGTIRRIFASELLRENALSPFLELIVPKSFASDALYLSPTIAKRLPALNMWKKFYGDISPQDIDAENRDYSTVYDRYCAFLDDNGLYEPSWQDIFCPTDGIHYVLFYPSILEDWVQYKDTLCTLDSITIVDFTGHDETEKPHAHLYPNARMELRKVALYIRQLLDNGEDASLIAINAPGIAISRPYIERELRLYDIPFVTHLALPLATLSVGKMFRAIYDCYVNDFSLSSVRILLQSSSVPWSYYDANGTEVDWSTELVRLGSEMRCLCHYEVNGQKINPWDEVFAQDTHLERERRWYVKLKNAVRSFVTANSFTKMREAWFASWRGELLDNEAFNKDSDRYFAVADNIISRCIAVLYKIENEDMAIYAKSGIRVSNPYEFFLNELTCTLYTPQSDMQGVNIFDYRVASSGAFNHNIVINASQADVTVSYKTLDFLSEGCRTRLIPEEMRNAIDVSKKYLLLYNMGDNEAAISASSKGFAGFTTPHSYLDIVQNENADNADNTLDANDFVTKEHELFENTTKITTITARQSREIHAWAFRKMNKDKPKDNMDVHNAVFRVLCGKDCTIKKFSADNVAVISATAMNNFFPCARKWLLNSVLKLKDEQTFDTDLMSEYSIGNIEHMILENYCNAYKVLPATVSDDTFGAYEDDVRHAIFEAARSAFTKVSDSAQFVSYGSPLLETMPLVNRAFALQIDGYVKRIMTFLHKVCRPDEIKDGSVSKYFLGNKTIEGVEMERSIHEDGAPYMLYGRLDCLCSTDAGDYIIADYKSGTMPTAGDSTVSDDGKIANFQMPMYATLMEENICSAMFLNISNGKDITVISPLDKPITNYHSTVVRLKEYAAHFVARAEKCDFNPMDNAEAGFALLNVWENCTRCAFNSICRKTFTSTGLNEGTL